MKKLITLFALFAIVLGVNAQNVFEVGDKRVDINIGGGIVNYTECPKMSFDQHINLEWIVAKLGKKVSLGVGMALNNIYGGFKEAVISGEYDYTYTKTISTYNTAVVEQVARKGKGTADADISRDDINAMATVSFHYSPTKKLDTYIKVGAGFGCISYIVDNVYTREGFYSENVYKALDNSHNAMVRYRYNDLDHTNWPEYDIKFAGSVAAYIGATYYFNGELGLDAQIGLISANLSNKAKNANAFSLFALGIAYKF